jgi:hypothetical protein
MKTILSLLFFIVSSLFAEFEYRVENSNIQISEAYAYNYNRLRLDTSYNAGEYFAKFIADGVNYYGEHLLDSAEFDLLQDIKADTPFAIRSSSNTYENGTSYAKIHRAYGGYEDDKMRITFGLQNITMGVGRFWNPTDIFNPKNIYAIEIDETFPVLALSYTRHLSQMSDLSVVCSVKEDDSLKYAARLKGFLEYGDAALSVIYSDFTKMLGYELEANLFDTGIEIRSEGAYISSKLTNDEDEREFFQAILGAEYGFVNGINLTFESLYNSKKFQESDLLLNLDSEILQNMKTSKIYAGLGASYAFNIFLDGSLTYIESFDDYKPFISASLNYTLNDYNTFLFGVMRQEHQSYYLKYQLSF